MGGQAWLACQHSNLGLERWLDKPGSHVSTATLCLRGSRQAWLTVLALQVLVTAIPNPVCPSQEGAARLQKDHLSFHRQSLECFLCTQAGCYDFAPVQLAARHDLKQVDQVGVLATLEHTQLPNGRDGEPCGAHRHLALQVPAFTVPSLSDSSLALQVLASRSDAAGQGTQPPVTESPLVDMNTIRTATASICLQHDTVS